MPESQVLGNFHRKIQLDSLAKSRLQSIYFHFRHAFPGWRLRWAIAHPSQHNQQKILTPRGVVMMECGKPFHWNWRFLMTIPPRG
jgi:hypothetical protein